MRFAFRQIDELPRLAWCARLKEGSSTVAVTHGPWVETAAEWFVEGAWDAEFGDGKFDETSVFMGSGGRIVGDRVRFATPCTMYERLFLVRTAGSLFVSNSLAFLLEASGLRLDSAYPAYANDLWSQMHGFVRCAKSIPTENGPRVRLCYYSNIEIDGALNVMELAKPDPPMWDGYSGYRQFLVDCLSRLSLNGNSPHRHIHYSLLSTISVGYDSAAVTALATEVGCRRAITFRKGQAWMADGSESNDSGAAVGRILGVEVKEFSRSDWRAGGERVAAEFAAGGDAFDLQLAGLECELPQKMLCTGLPSPWDRRYLPNRQLFSVPTPNGSSSGEFRLRVGYIHLPVPTFGAIWHPEIHAISNGPEMRPWRLGNRYDKPIPRRILEDKGVPRDAFGQHKLGSFSAVQWGDHPNPWVSGFEQFYETHRRKRPLLTRGLLRVRSMLGMARAKCNGAAKRLGLPRPFGRFTQFDVVKPNRLSLIVQWGNSVVQPRYRSCGP